MFGLSALEKDLASIHREHVAFLKIFKRGNLKALERAVEEHIVRNAELVEFERLIASRRR